MSTAPEYTKRVEERLRRSYAGLVVLAKGAAKNLESAKAALALAEAQVELAAKLDDEAQTRKRRASDAMKRLRAMKKDPVVLIRVVGPNAYTYHDAEDPCGWVRDETRYERVLWGEAQDDSYKPCSSCGARADRRARIAHGDPTPTRRVRTSS